MYKVKVYFYDKGNRLFYEFTTHKYITYELAYEFYKQCEYDADAVFLYDTHDNILKFNI